MWATRLHLYGGKEEMALLSAANQVGVLFEWRESC